jgi:tRNA threonylcarbamoyladenosine biosynthesis protein TsaE
MSRDGWKKKVQGKFFSASPEETAEIARLFMSHLKSPKTVALHGTFGTGKTTFVKGLAAHCKDSLVHSPTFTYLQIYPGNPPIFHFDLYRIKTVEEFIQMGFTDYFDQEGICCIEWPQQVEKLLPANTIHITLGYEGDHTRRITIKNELE